MQLLPPFLDALRLLPWTRLNDTARAYLTPIAARHALFHPVGCRSGTYTTGLGHPRYPSSPYGTEYGCDREGRKGLQATLFPGVQFGASHATFAAPAPNHVILVAGSPKSSPAHAQVSAHGGGVLRIERPGLEDVVMRSSLTFVTNPGIEVRTWMPGPRVADHWTENQQTVVTRTGREYRALRDNRGILVRDHAVVRVMPLEFGGLMVFFAGGHLVGTRACGQVSEWLRGAALARALSAQRASATGGWECLLQVDHVVADVIAGSKGRATLVDAWPVEQSPT